MRITGDLLIKFSHSFFRPKGALFLFGLVGSFCLYSRFVFDAQLKLWLEKELTQLNGAQVNIGSLESRLLSGQFSLSQIELGNPITPMRNTFQVDSVKIELDVAPLFRKKLNIKNMEVRGVHYWTQRLEPGAFTDEMSLSLLPAALMDRASSGIYSGIRNELTDNPLRHLGQLGTGFTLPSKMGTISEKLRSVQHLRGILQSLREKEPVWERQKADLPSPAALAGMKDRLAKTSSSDSAEEIKNKIHQIQNEIHQLQEEVQVSAQKLSEIDQFVEEDISVVRRELGLPRIDYEDLTTLTFGPAWLGHLEKLSYWLEFSRNHSPVGTRSDLYGMTVMKRSGKRSVHFGKIGALPSFLLQKATVQSGGNSQDKTLIQMEGMAQGSNSDPVLFGKPSFFELTADYPQEGFRNLKLSALIDHTQEVPKETLDLTIESFKVNDWPITRTSDIQLKIQKALAGLDLHGIYEGNQIKFDWKIGVSEAEYGIQTRFRPVELSIQKMVSGLYSFNIQGSISGPVTALEFNSQSDLGKRLAQGLQTEFKHEFGALNEAIETETRNLFPPLKEDIQIRLSRLKDETLPQFQKALNQLQSLL